MSLKGENLRYFRVFSGGEAWQLGALPGWDGLGMLLGLGILPRLPNSCHGRMNFAASGTAFRRSGSVLHCTASFAYFSY